MDGQQSIDHEAETRQGPVPMTEAVRRQVFEQFETQHYQLVLPAEYEELRGYLENDGLLSDEEITKCLYDDTLRRKDMAKLVAEKKPDADKSDQHNLSNYLWDVHESVKGLPLGFVDPKQAYQINVVDTGPPPLPTPSVGEQPYSLNQSISGGAVSPVTLHLDINGGFLANFLHNARLNHEQMNRFIADLEQQHKQLKSQVDYGRSQQQPTEISKPERTTPDKPYQLLQESGPSQTSWQRIRQTVSEWIAPTSAKTQQPEGRTQDGTNAELHQRPQKEPPDKQPFSPGQEAMTSPNTTRIVNEPMLHVAPSIANQQTHISMRETSTPGIESPVADKQTRYQWQDVSAQFDKIGVSRQDLEKAGQLDDLLNGRKTGLMKLTQAGEEGKPFQILGKLYIVNTPDKGPIIGIKPERKQLLLPKEFLGYELTARDKQNLEKNGEMAKRVELTDKMTGNKFAGYVGVDKETKSLTVLRAERLHIPQTIKGVTLNKQQQKNLEQGRAIKLEGMTSNNGQSFNAYVQVSAAKRSLTFAKIPDNAVKQTVDQKTAQDLTKPVQQLKGDGAGGKKTIQPKEEAKQAAAQRVEAPKPAKQQKMAAPKPALDENKLKRTKKQKGPSL